LGEAIVKLKEEPGGDILVGGVDVPSQLVELGLVDEFRFVVGPMVVGEGRRLFDEVRLAESLRMKLVETKVLKSGTVALHYLKQ
jgi:dihydrofolate reductase